MTDKRRTLILLTVGILLVAAILMVLWQPVSAPQQEFDGGRAMQDVIAQVEFGPRTPGSQAHGQTVAYITSQLENAGWQTQVQETTRMNHSIRNVIARRGNGTPWIILGAHYDTRFFSDQETDPSFQLTPVPGANDGASGVAVLLELARVLPANLPLEIWLVFFDAEDQGRISDWDWILGSRAFVESLTAYPDKVVIVDMIGDADLNIYQERNSDPALTSEIWEVAASLGYQAYFIPETKYSILDDHTPFLEKGITAIDIIDFDYPYWHTTADTLDKVSSQSLEIVGKTLYHWLTAQE